MIAARLGALAQNGGLIQADGGSVTQAGTLDATGRGGALSGNGGLIETSGKSVVHGADAHVNTLAPSGKTGTWLLDPVNYTIALVGGDETPAQVALRLASSNRVVAATNDITVGSALTWTTPQTPELNAGLDVLVNATITSSTASCNPTAACISLQKPDRSAPCSRTIRRNHHSTAMRPERCHVHITPMPVEVPLFWRSRGLVRLAALA